MRLDIAVLFMKEPQLSRNSIREFSKSSDNLRDAFFQGIAHCPFTVCALIVNKELLHSQRLRTHADTFYTYFVKMLIAHDDGILSDTRVRIDGSSSREFQRSLGRYLRRELW
jgi:hypothetical protein